MNDSTPTCTTSPIAVDPTTQASPNLPATVEPQAPEAATAAASPATPQDSQIIRCQPRWNHRRTEHGATIEIALPGVPRQEVQLTSRHGSLTIDGRRINPQTTRQHTGEIPPTHYHLELRLDPVFDTSLTTATYHDGLLTLVVPLAESARPRRIELS